MILSREKITSRRMILKALKTFLTIWDITMPMLLQRLTNHGSKTTLSALQYLFSSCGIFTAEAVQSQFSYKTNQGNLRSYIKPCSKREGEKCILAALKAFLMNYVIP